MIVIIPPVKNRLKLFAYKHDIETMKLNYGV